MTQIEPWMDKRKLAEHLSCSVRWIERQMAEGMPHHIGAGRVKFKASEVDPWLEQRGLFRRVR